MSDNIVTFTRIGRHGGRDGSPAPEPIVRALSGEQLADSIAMYARRFLASPAFEVVYDTETGRGFILAGFRTAGEFTVTPSDAPQTRRAWLATAIQTEPAPVTTQRAAELLAASPWPTSGRNTARKDLRALVQRGVLAAVDTGGRRTYTTTVPDWSAA